VKAVIVRKYALVFTVTNGDRESLFLGIEQSSIEEARSSDYLFSFKHEEFQNAVIDIVIALKDYLK
jgi:hypothetical protein